MNYHSNKFLPIFCLWQRLFDFHFFLPLPFKEIFISSEKFCCKKQETPIIRWIPHSPSNESLELWRTKFSDVYVCMFGQLLGRNWVMGPTSMWTNFVTFIFLNPRFFLIAFLALCNKIPRLFSLLPIYLHILKITVQLNFSENFRLKMVLVI